MGRIVQTHRTEDFSYPKRPTKSTIRFGPTEVDFPSDQVQERYPKNNYKQKA